MVTDCILVQFSALTLFMLALPPHGPRFLAVRGRDRRRARHGHEVHGRALPFYEYLVQVRRAAALCLLAFVVYLVTTPGTVLDVFTFLKETHYISKYYLSSHGGFTAAGAWDHARIVASYFALAYFSPYLPLAAALFAGVVAGGVLSLKRDVRFGAVLVGFPLAFLVFFCIKFRVVMVRNWRAGSELHRSGPGLARASARGRRAASTLRVSYQNRENPWFEYDFGKPLAFSSLVVRNRSDFGPELAIPLIAELSNDGKAYREVARRSDPFIVWRPRFKTESARYLRLRVPRRTILHLEEVSVYR